MERIELLKKMLQQHRVGFMLDETMRGTHHFVNGAGPVGEHPMHFRITWGTRHLESFLNPLDPYFLTNFVEGTVTVGGLCEEAPCRGTLELRYFQEAKIRYRFDFKGPDERPYRFVGEKIDLKPWNLHQTHTTCFGVITDLTSDQEISQSVVRFELAALPAFLMSFRLG